MVKRKTFSQEVFGKSKFDSAQFETCELLSTRLITTKKRYQGGYSMSFGTNSPKKTVFFKPKYLRNYFINHTPIKNRVLLCIYLGFSTVSDETESPTPVLWHELPLLLLN